MNAFEVDYEKIRETMIAMGEFLARRGFSKPLQDIEGTGAIAEAVRDPRDAQAFTTIKRYMKGLAREMLEEERKELAQRGHSSRELIEAKAGLDEAWQHIKAAVR